MPARSALWRGFQAVARQPALLLAEITWRWCVAAAGWLLAAVTLLQFLNSVPVLWREQALLKAGGPLLGLAAVVHALRGSGARLAAAMIISGTALAVLWIFGAALGRLISLKVLIRVENDGAYRSLLGLSFLRAGLFLAAALAAAAALIVAGFAGSPRHATPSLVVAAVLIACIWLVWALLNWLLSLAAIFVAGNGEDTFGSIAAAVSLIETRCGEVVVTSLPFVLLHYAALASAVAAGVLIVDVMTRVSPTAGWALVATAAGYFAYADLLYITRLATYVSLAAPGSEPSVVPEPGAFPAPDVPSPVEDQLPATSY